MTNSMMDVPPIYLYVPIYLSIYVQLCPMSMSMGSMSIPTPVRVFEERSAVRMNSLMDKLHIYLYVYLSIYISVQVCPCLLIPCPYPRHHKQSMRGGHLLRREMHTVFSDVVHKTMQEILTQQVAWLFIRVESASSNCRDWNRIIQLPNIRCYFYTMINLVNECGTYAGLYCPPTGYPVQ